MIEGYSFGKIFLSGRQYSSDIIIYPSGKIDSSWWRSAGHQLKEGDIKELIASQPEFILAGMGTPGMMKPETGLKDKLEEKGIRFEALPTARAVARFNELSPTHKVGACLHLTC